MKYALRVVAVLLALAPAGVQAQQTATAAQCEPDLNTPQLVARTWFAMSQAISAINANTDPTNHLKNALRTLTDPRGRDREQNVVTQEYLTAQAYILLMAAGTPSVVRRGDIGIQTDADATIDLFTAADSLLTSVERAMPQCAVTIAEWRQQKPWLDVVNAAINALNANQLDSAEALARRSLILDRRAPYAYNVLATVARERRQDSVAIGLYRQALEAAGTDTIFADVRVKTLGDIAALMAARARTAPAAQRRAFAREAVTAFETYLAERELEDLQRGVAISELANLYVAAGDSARIRNAYAAVLANPPGFGERTLLEAGVVAMRAGASRDAATLFAAAHAVNPHGRDALNNLAAAYVATEQFDRVFPLVTRLVEMDPNNPDVYLLYAYTYGGMLRGARTPAQRTAWTDSLVKYNTIAENLPTRVTFSEFSRLRAETRVRGTVENRARTPKTYTVEVELIGRDGAVITTQTVSVGPVAAGQSAPFSVTFTTPGPTVSGFRYRRLP